MDLPRMSKEPFAALRRAKIYEIAPTSFAQWGGLCSLSIVVKSTDDVLVEVQVWHDQLQLHC